MNCILPSHVDMRSKKENKNLLDKEFKADNVIERQPKGYHRNSHVWTSSALPIKLVMAPVCLI